ncbi:hypothetical protein J5U18_04865 [Sphingobacteriaceae bacterium WQ 2009]|uniref:Uncharacterized protein n=1 Tax=Rhinopithecimicrobium faecis TaxID=2820698 RepID=A0A8T4HDU6_9SPHI|nr:hypothetical protein [Sphingobacteriaceae bacterium WQ 2009]
MHINELPTFLRSSQVLTMDELALLCESERLPTDEEVESIRDHTDIQDLLNAFLGDDSTKEIHLQLKAKEYLKIREIDMAWKVLFL